MMQSEKRNHRGSNSVTYKSSKRPTEADTPSGWELASLLDAVLANTAFKRILLTCCCTLTMVRASGQELVLPPANQPASADRRSTAAAAPLPPVSKNHANLMQPVNQTIRNGERVELPPTSDNHGANVVGTSRLPESGSNANEQGKSMDRKTSALRILPIGWR